MTLSTGNMAPDFTLPTDGGGTCSLSALRGKTVILYFYPKDNTPGCTKEALEFRDAMPGFSKCNAEIVGASRDSARKHDRFKAKHELNFNLVADEEGTLCETYGVWVEKNLYGRKYMGIERATFLIDGEGIIREIWRKVRVKGHVDTVLSAVQEL